jgi:Ca2+:H+ antiporter
VMALRKGLYPVVKASLTGSIIGNILLVLGAAALAGGMKYKHQKFNRTGACAQATLLTLAAIGLIAPAAFHHLGGPRARLSEDAMSLAIALVLFSAYVCHLMFSLFTHRSICSSEPEPGHAAIGAPASLKRALGELAISTAFIAWISEILVGSVEAAALSFGMTGIFLGVIVVAVVGNAAEHSTAVMMAMKNRMEISMGIAIGSSLQIALFVAPLLVLVSHFVGPRPMDLVFTPAEVLAVFLAVMITGQIAADGETNWLEGVQLLAVYLILAVVFYFLPEFEGA